MPITVENRTLSDFEFFDSARNLVDAINKITYTNCYSRSKKIRVPNLVKALGCKLGHKPELIKVLETIDKIVDKTELRNLTFETIESDHWIQRQMQYLEQSGFELLDRCVRIVIMFSEKNKRRDLQHFYAEITKAIVANRAVLQRIDSLWMSLAYHEDRYKINIGIFNEVADILEKNYKALEQSRNDIAKIRSFDTILSRRSNYISQGLPEHEILEKVRRDIDELYGKYTKNSKHIDLQGVNNKIESIKKQCDKMMKASKNTIKQLNAVLYTKGDEVRDMVK